MRYWKAIAPEAAGVSAEQMAAVLAMYPMVKQGDGAHEARKAKLAGTPLATTITTFEAVKSKEQLAQESESAASSGGGGLGGMLARKMMKKDEREAARDDLDGDHRDARDRDHRRRRRPRDPRRLQGEEVSAVSAARRVLAFASAPVDPRGR